MCIEVYHPGAPLRIEYESELLSYSGLKSYCSKHVLLIRNDGDEAITELRFIYPRYLYELKETGNWVLSGIDDTTSQIPSILRGVVVSQDTLTLTQPDPNHPETDRVVTGEYLPNDGSIISPGPIPEDGLSFLRKVEYSLFQYNLARLLAPGKCLWLSFSFEVHDVGALVPRIPGGCKAVFHQIASPHDVSRTLKEQLGWAITRASEPGGAWEWAHGALTALRTLLAIPGTRNVDIVYYELLIRPGPPEKRFIMHWSVERDLRMRSRSPRFGEDPLREPLGALVYEWKSGSMLLPQDVTWRNEGFILHLTLVGTSDKED